MSSIDLTICRPETLYAAVIYLMTVYQREPCTSIARAIVAHLDRLARHIETSDVIRQIARGLYGEWQLIANAATSAHAGTRPVFN
jgi:hypothetical protein